MESIQLISMADIKDTLYGATVWWDCARLVNVDDLRAALAAAGVSEAYAPQDATVVHVVNRVLRHIYETRTTLVRSVGGRDGRYAVCPRSDRDGKVNYTETFRVEVSVDASNCVNLVYEGGISDEEKARISRNVEKHFVLLDGTNINLWLTDVAKRLKALQLRQGTGLYFLPRDPYKVWETVVDVCRQLNCVVPHCIPTVRTTQAVEAVMDSMTRMVEAETADIQERLTRAHEARSSGQTRGVTKSLNSCEADKNDLLKKIAEYEQMLGAKLDTLRAKVEDLQEGGGVVSAVIDADYYDL